MSYVICEPCVGTKDTTCRDACPVDAIHEEDDKLYIGPTECIDFGAYMSGLHGKRYFPGKECSQCLVKI